MSDPSHSTAFQAPDIEEVARLFPNYSIVRLIACGGMGAVYEALQSSLDRQVAIKILPREFSGDEAFREGFKSEAKAMAKLNHPNLIGVYDFGEADGMLYIVMEYVAGNSLFASSNKKRIEQSVALSIIEGVCHGLANAHSHGILHRDIKPSNVLLDRKASPKIGDFGLARALEREIQEGEQIFGTPGYTAPEVLQPPFTIDQRADIFSVGVMLHELLTGQLPGADPRSPSQICGCSFRIDPIVRKATHKNPSQRYSTCEELAAAIAKVIAINATGGLVTAVARASSALPTPGKYVPRKPAKSSTGLGFIVFLLVLAAVIAYFVMNQGPIAGQGGTKTPETPAPVIEKVIKVAPVSPPPGVSDTSGAEKGFDAEAFLERLKSSINRDLADERKSFLASRRESGGEYGEKLKELAKAVGDGAVNEAVAAYLIKINEADGRVAINLPGEINKIPGAPELSNEYLKQQRRMLKAMNQAVQEKKSYYILELESAILKNKDAASPEALKALEDELSRVKSESDYFENTVVDIKGVE